MPVSRPSSEIELEKPKVELSATPATTPDSSARRPTTEKRANLLLGYLDVVATIMHDARRPVRFMFVGKAHPFDDPGKKRLEQVVQMTHRFDRFIFIEDYDINVGRYLVQGVDVAQFTPPFFRSLGHTRAEGCSKRRAQSVRPGLWAGASVRIAWSWSTQRSAIYRVRAERQARSGRPST